MSTFPYIAGFRAVDALRSNPLLLPGFSPKYIPVVILTGQQILPGTVVGKANSGANAGKVVVSVKTATDGSQIPYGITVDMIDTTAAGPAGAAGDINCDVLVAGIVNASAIVVDTTWGLTPDTVWAALEPYLRTIGLFGRFPGYSG